MDEIIEFIKKPMNIILMGTIITIAGALFGGMVTGVGTYIQNKNNSERNKKIESGLDETVVLGRSTNSEVSQLKNQNKDLIDKVENQAKTIDNLRKQNADLFGKLQEASETIFKNIKGGQDPIYLEAVQVNNQDYEIWLKNNNKYPVYGLTLDIFDYDEALKCKSVIKNDRYYIESQCYFRLSKSFIKDRLEIGQLPLGNWINVNFKNFFPNDIGRYQIKFRTQNKLFYQQLVYKKLDNRVFVTSRVFEAVNPNDDSNDFIIKNIIRAENIEGWNVDFNHEFPTGLIIYVGVIQ